MPDMHNEYAAALFSLAMETGSESAYARALEDVQAVFHAEPDYVAFLASPAIAKAERTQALEQAFASVLPEHVLSFLQLLCERGHIGGLDGCVAEYRKLLDEHLRMSTAKVTSYLPLTEEEKQRLKEKLEKSSGHTVILECGTDEGLLGGMVVEMDGKIMDGSLRRRLQDIKDVIRT